MIPRIKTLAVLDDFRLAVEFDDGYKVIYDVKEDIETLPSFDLCRRLSACLVKRNLTVVGRVCIGMMK